MYALIDLMGDRFHQQIILKLHIFYIQEYRDQAACPDLDIPEGALYRQAPGGAVIQSHICRRDLLPVNALLQ